MTIDLAASAQRGDAFGEARDVALLEARHRLGLDPRQFDVVEPGTPDRCELPGERSTLVGVGPPPRGQQHDRDRHRQAVRRAASPRQLQRVFGQCCGGISRVVEDHGARSCGSQRRPPREIRVGDVQLRLTPHFFTSRSGVACLRHERVDRRRGHQPVAVVQGDRQLRGPEQRRAGIVTTHRQGRSPTEGEERIALFTIIGVAGGAEVLDAPTELLRRENPVTCEGRDGGDHIVDVHRIGPARSRASRREHLLHFHRAQHQGRREPLDRGQPGAAVHAPFEVADRADTHPAGVREPILGPQQASTVEPDHRPETPGRVIARLARLAHSRGIAPDVEPPVRATLPLARKRARAPHRNARRSVREDDMAVVALGSLTLER